MWDLFNILNAVIAMALWEYELLALPYRNSFKL